MSNPNAVLMIIKGIAKVPQDTASSEQGLDSINLLDPSGFSCDEYVMQTPNLKSGATWMDSPIVDGRTLVSGAFDNVTETIRLALNAGSLVQMAALLSKLAQFRQNCNDFWDTFAQIEPIYLKHQIEGEPGPRFALLYNIDIHLEQPISPGEPNRIITLSIERESYWRGLAPGDNPRRWTIENFFSGQTWNNTNADLLSGGNHLVDGTIQNRLEWNTTQTALLTKNYLDIPAASIPGDAPALVEMAIQRVVGSATSINRIYLGKSSKPDLSVSGTERKVNYILVAADGSSGTDATDANDTGAPIESSTGVNKRKAVSFATVTALATRVSWTPASTGTYFDLSTLRGRFMVFTRARLSTASTVELNLVLTDDNGVVTYPSATLTGVGAGGTGNTTAWEVVYLGLLTFPFNEQRIVIGNDGLGVEVPTSGSTPTLSLQAERVGGAVNLYIADVIFIPIDEGSWIQESGAVLGPNNSFIYDNTGYYLHGRPGTYISDDNSSTTENVGSEFYLVPNQRNRLVMLLDISAALTGSGPQSTIDNAYRFRINIVPRWVGLRTV